MADKYVTLENSDMKKRLGVVLSIWLSLAWGQAVQASDDILHYADEIRAQQSDAKPFNDRDPYESINRPVYAFNMAFNDAIFQPLGTAYKRYVPTPAQTGVSNVYRNLGEPLNMANAFLQGNVEGGLTSLMRFALNTTLGLFGLLDIGTEAGLKYQDEDFGQTLYVWGFWDEASYLVLPFLGPSTTRGLIGKGVDAAYDPTYPHLLDFSLRERIAMGVGNGFVQYVAIMPLIEELKQQPDPYIFARESYLQNRTDKLYNGNPPLAPLDDFNFD
ncbi:MAG: VacJ family lipoprotein [Hydrogenovibrio sp.]|uniref:MlaA family lipoprotein n=1 Tax=Hydrogenovibrio sp. TaxID=2065821 RepID=UPI00286FCF4B|nr:VacJ family lipoprotein [Hydrogenovibrio sp.]MDR9498230.1 VacJ family lipoprotein [Hydrogenovibrio sp.]